MRLFTLAAALLCASLAPMADAAYSRVFVFGDSLSDNGNAFLGLNGATETKPYTKLIPDMAYESGRLSNGPVWVDFIAPTLVPVAPPALFSLNPVSPVPPFIDLSAGANMAVGSARSGPLAGVTPNPVPTLLDQAQGLRSLLPTLPNDALYVVWAGGNDARDALDRLVATGDPDAFEAVLQSALFNVGDILGVLAAGGADDFLLLNMPDLTRTPAVRLADLVNGNSNASDAIGSFVAGYNAGLLALVAEFENDTGIDVLTLDTFELISTVLDNPGDFGFTDITSPCIFGNAGQGCSDPDAHFFWDGLHPTSAAHRLIADAVIATVAPVPVPGALPLLLSALAVPALLARRRRN